MNNVMNDLEWRALFPPTTKPQWIDKILEDHKGSISIADLQRDFGEGLTIDPFYTRSDLSGIAYLDPSTEDPGPAWVEMPGWDVGYPLDPNAEAGEVHQVIQDAIACGATSLVIGDPDDASSSLESFPGWAPEELLSHMPQDDVSLHMLDRPPSFRDWFEPMFKALGRRPESTSTLPVFPSTSPSSPDALGYYLEGLESLPLFSSRISTIVLTLPAADGTPASQLFDLLRRAEAILGTGSAGGYPFEQLINSLAIYVSVGSSFYFEISRIRALKRLMAKLVHHLMPSYTSPLRIPILASVTDVRYSPDRPQSSLIRATTSAMSAVLGGCDTLIIRPYENATSGASSASPFSESSRLTLNVQHILRHEAHLDRVVDPGAGSYYIERFTHALYEKAWFYYDRSHT